MLGESYPDERFHELVLRTAAVAGVPDDDVLERFGAFTAEHTVARLYPAVLEIAPSARAFLLTVETRIHELVRATAPSARAREGRGRRHDRVRPGAPPLRLLRGLVAGTAAHDGERAEIDESACMQRGDSACVLAVRLSLS